MGVGTAMAAEAVDPCVLTEILVWVFKIFISASTPSSKISVTYSRKKKSSWMKESGVKSIKCCGRGRGRSSMLRAVDIQTNVNLRLVPSEISRNSLGPRPACASRGSANWQEQQVDECRTTNKMSWEQADLEEEHAVTLRRGSDAPCLVCAWRPLGGVTGRTAQEKSICFGNCFQGLWLEESGSVEGK